MTYSSLTCIVAFARSTAVTTASASASTLAFTFASRFRSVRIGSNSVLSARPLILISRVIVSENYKFLRNTYKYRVQLYSRRKYLSNSNQL